MMSGGMNESATLETLNFRGRSSFFGVVVVEPQLFWKESLDDIVELDIYCLLWQRFGHVGLEHHLCEAAAWLRRCRLIVR